MWLSIVVWGIWFVAGIVLLKEYDDYFKNRSALVSQRTKGRPWLFYLGWLIFISGLASISYFLARDKMLRDPEIVFIIKHLPGFYFYALAMSYYYGTTFLSIGLLFIIWKIFREKRPGVVLWSEDMQSGGPSQ